MSQRTNWLFLLLILGGCGFGSKSAESSFEDKGLIDVLKDAGEDEYDPPADGKLTDAQVQMYLKVRQREMELAKVAGEDLKEKEREAGKAAEEGSVASALKGLDALRSLGNYLTADVRAAQELGFNSAEYLWVKEKVVEANVEKLTQNMAAGFRKSLEEGLVELKEQRQSTNDENARSFLDSQIAGMEEQLAAMDAEQSSSEEQAALKANQELLAKYADQLNVIEDALKKMSLEMDSGSEDPGH